ncbi:MAG: hypothetical protein KKA07_04750 [Bacteroidetes bacterium]|nr:hypothetical protein [Bacteroidota bacterium]
MKITDIIANKINRFPLDYVFTYDDFDIDVSTRNAFTKALSRMVQDGKIRKVAPGRFYKPRQSEFGELKPDTYQIVKDLLQNNGKIIGYITGFSAFNDLGLSTQVPAIIQIGTNEPRKAIRRGIYRIRFVKQPNRITKENIPFLRILDAIRNIKSIPDATVVDSVSKLLKRLAKFSKYEQELFLRLATKYNPATLALALAMMEHNFGSDLVAPYQSHLNPLSKYDFGIPEQILPNKQKWSIV